MHTEEQGDLALATVSTRIDEQLMVAREIAAILDLKAVLALRTSFLAVLVRRERVANELPALPAGQLDRVFEWCDRRVRLGENLRTAPAQRVSHFGYIRPPADARVALKLHAPHPIWADVTA